jgi:hypothetical protein
MFFVQKVVTLQMKFCKNYRTFAIVTEFFRPNWPKIRRRGWQHCPVVLLIYIRTCLLVREGGEGGGGMAPYRTNSGWSDTLLWLIEIYGEIKNPTTRTATIHLSFMNFPCSLVLYS